MHITTINGYEIRYESAVYAYGDSSPWFVLPPERGAPQFATFIDALNYVKNALNPNYSIIN